jgi:putative redox protein
MEILVKHDKGKRFIARCGNYTVVTGIAEGDDEEQNGMWPGQLFIAALGACIAGYVTHFCERHDMPYEGMSVELDYENSDSPSRVVAVHARLNLPVPVPEKFRQALLRVAEQCYITQSIEHRMRVNVSLAQDSS